MRKVAKRYARALFDSVKKDSLTEVREVITGLAKVLESTKDLKAALHNPGYPMKERASVLGAVAEGLAGSHKEVVALSIAMLENRRLPLMKEVAEVFGEMVDAYQRLLSLQIVSAYELNDQEKSEIASSMRTQLGADVTISWNIEPDLIGGLRIKAGDVVLDNSVQANLQKISEALVA